MHNCGFYGDALLLVVFESDVSGDIEVESRKIIMHYEL